MCEAALRNVVVAEADNIAARSWASPGPSLSPNPSKLVDQP